MGWPRKKLGELCRPRQWPTLSKSEMLPKGVPVYGANGIIGFTDEPTHHHKTILIGCRGSCGTVHVLAPPAYANGNAMALDDLRDDLVFLPYLEHHLRHRGFDDVTTGASQPQIVQRNLNLIEIPLPPLEEQKRIATILDQADDIRRKRQHAIERLNQLGQAIFYEMFGDITTNPMGWDTVKLGDACGVGSSKRVFVEEFVELGVPFYRGTEVGKLATGEKIAPDLFISSDHYDDLTGHSGKPMVGDLLLPSICHDGRIWRVDTEKPFYFKDGRVLWIKQNESILDGEYLRNHLRNAFLRNYNSIASGTTFAELKIINLKGMSILCPPLHLQKQFSERLRKAELCRIEMVQSGTASDALFASLQKRAFAGELLL